MNYIVFFGVSLLFGFKPIGKGFLLNGCLAVFEDG